MVLLENVTGALKSNRGEIPFFDKLLLALRSAVPFWRWGVDEVNCKDYLSAQNRPRVVLRGTRGLRQSEQLCFLFTHMHSLNLALLSNNAAKVMLLFL